MIPSLIRLTLREPGLLAEHAEGYSLLARREFHLWRTRTRKRVLWWFAAALLAMLALIMTGCALMLWATTMNAHWLLWVVPGVPWLMALLAAGQAASQPDPDVAFDHLWDQVDADLRLLKEIAE